MNLFRKIINQIFSESPDFQFLTIFSENEQKVHKIEELEKRVTEYCRFYHENSVKEGDIVLIILKESLDLFAAFFAAIISGILPGFYAYPSSKHSIEKFETSVDDLLEFNKVNLVITFKEVKEVLKSKSKHLRCFDHESILPGNRSTHNESVSLCFNEAFLQFSSGTTGAKKGVKITVQALLNQIEAYEKFVLFDESSTVVSWLPHYHDMGLIACMLMPFLKKVPIIMLSPFEWVKNPKIVIKAITDFQGTHTWMPNFALGHLVNNVTCNDLGKFSFTSIKQFVLCSEPVLFESVEKFCEKFSGIGFDRKMFCNCYAMAENTFAISSSKTESIQFLEVNKNAFQKNNTIVIEKDGLKISSVGSVLDNIDVKVRNEFGECLKEKNVGEVTIKSNCMLECYHNNPKETSGAFIDGYFKTGDLGFFHDNELYICGRKKDLVIVGGENIYPQDIETVLNEIDSLIPGRNVVFGIQDENIGTERVVALAEVREGSGIPDSIDLKKKIMDSLNVSVHDIIFLKHKSLLKGTAGKISRYLNKKEFMNGSFKSYILKSDIIDENELLEQLQNIIFSMIPDAEKSLISYNTPLFHSGLLDSLSFANLITFLEKEFDLSIPDNFLKIELFQDLEIMVQTVRKLLNGKNALSLDENEVFKERNNSLDRLKRSFSKDSGKGAFAERIVNYFPLRGNLWYTILFKMLGISIGKNVRFLGKIRLKVRGKPENIIIEDNVIFGDNVDLRNRENGKIIFREKVHIDNNVRIVVARDGEVEIGLGSSIGANTIVNSGGKIKIGKFVMIAGNCNINSSSHGTKKDFYMREQPHQHGQVVIGDDVWIGSGASIVMNTKINTGAVISSNSLVAGNIPPFAFCVGVPAKIVRYR